MGKSVASVRTKPKGKVAKGKASSPGNIRTLDDFVERLEKEAKDKSSKQVLPIVHSYIKETKIKKPFDYRQLKEKLRICKICDKWNNIKAIIQCTICEDNYHQYCLEFQKTPNYICNQCKGAKKATTLCAKCKKKVSKQQEIKCQQCDAILHKKCFKGKLKTCRKCCNLKKQQDKAKKFDPQIHYKKEIQNEDTIASPPSALFQYERLVNSQQELIKYSTSLTEAIQDKKMLYSEQLINMEEFKDIQNENSMDFGINFMKKAEREAYELYKKFPIGSYIFKKIEGKGYDVVADKPIPAKSLICEYVGEVVTLRQCIQLQSKRQNDSLMELQAGKNSDETLIIRPEKFTNMARFINGVRKNSSAGNIETMKLLYKGTPKVLLVAKRDIKKGESLCYDYNAGGIAAEYDTSHFI